MIAETVDSDSFEAPTLGPHLLSVSTCPPDEVVDEMSEVVYSEVSTSVTTKSYHAPGNERSSKAEDLSGVCVTYGLDATVDFRSVDSEEVAVGKVNGI